MKEVKPITPAEAKVEKIKTIPPEVIEAFNELIVENLGSEGSATIYQDAVVVRILSKLDVDRDTIYNKHWLDIEPLYEKQGWKVNYDKPAYNESYEAHFEFSKRKQDES